MLLPETGPPFNRQVWESGFDDTDTFQLLPEFTVKLKSPPVALTVLVTPALISVTGPVLPVTVPLTGK